MPRRVSHSLQVAAQPDPQVMPPVPIQNTRIQDKKLPPLNKLFVSALPFDSLPCCLFYLCASLASMSCFAHKTESAAFGVF